MPPPASGSLGRSHVAHAAEPQRSRAISSPYPGGWPPPTQPAVAGPPPAVVVPNPAAPNLHPQGMAPVGLPPTGSVWPPPALPPQGPTPPRSGAGRVVAIVLLSVLSLVLLLILAFALARLQGAQATIDDQDRRIDEQEEFVDRKETFGAAMESLLETARQLDGVATGSAVPLDAYTALAQEAWSSRWSTVAMDDLIQSARTERESLDGLIAAAGLEASTNATGTRYEAVIDRLGSGLVATVMDDASALCGREVWGCVLWSDPYTVHIEPSVDTLVYVDDRIREGLAYHEFAHVLQGTNPEATEIALPTFGGDVETMADCFALTYLDGWTLDSVVWVDGEPWDVWMGYGYTCTEPERDVIRDWYDSLGVRVTPISQ